MASPVVGPPPSPPGVSGQMGGGPFAGIGALLQKSGGGEDSAPTPPGGAAPNPLGAITAQKDAIEKVLKQMAEQLPGFGPYGDRALQVIEMGIQSAAKSQSQSSSGSPQPPGAPEFVSPLGEGGAQR